MKIHLKRSQTHGTNFKAKYLDPLDDEELFKYEILIEFVKDILG